VLTLTTIVVSPLPAPA
jgi:hypothetical protein